jgi:hypothetical protein
LRRPKIHRWADKFIFTGTARKAIGLGVVVALDDKDIRELFDAMPLKTTVVIEH